MKKIEKISKRWQKISFSNKSYEHYPVLYREVIDLLKPEKRKVVVDATLGMAGHSLMMLELMPGDGLLIGMDRDSESLETARSMLAQYKERIRLFHANHSDLEYVLSQCSVKKADAFLFDLGISMFQMYDSQRGFSFLKNGALDMRMDRTAGISAYDLVNCLSEKELSDIISKYGEERQSQRIARAIVDSRKVNPIATTAELASIIESVAFSKGGRHPATRTFQALRIAVNSELDTAVPAVQKALELLEPGGAAAVITFHSLEDGMIKRLFKSASASGEFRLVNKKAVLPSYAEVKENSRSRSAKLRVIERIG